MTKALLLQLVLVLPAGILPAQAAPPAALAPPASFKNLRREKFCFDCSDIFYLGTPPPRKSDPAA